MAVTYTWQVTQMWVLDTDPATPEFVVQAAYFCAGEETSGGVVYTSEIQNTAFFEMKPDEPDFIPYADLTNEIVIGWIQAQLGPSGVENYEYCIADQIAAKINPPVTPHTEPLPWA